MGLLDDAIREHLELKRRRGADPAEIERAERDALGPARREPELPELAAFSEGDELYEPVREGVSEPADEWDPAEPELRVAEASYNDPEDDWPQEEAASHAGYALAPDPDEPDEGRAYEQLADATSAAHPAGESQPLGDEERWTEPQEEQSGGATGDLSPETRGETVEYSIGDPAGGGEPPSDPEPAEGDVHEAEGDVLEETPDFLQDTPDHDRLWFEQRPPRDFDFDG